MIFVLDASVGVKWFLDEEDSAPATDLLKEFSRRGSQYVVPELFFFEVYAVCARRHPDIDRFVSDGLKWINELPLRRIPMSMELAAAGVRYIKQGLTGYDAIYVALARRTNGIWITYDKHAAKKLGNPDWIRVLGGR